MKKNREARHFPEKPKMLTQEFSAQYQYLESDKHQSVSGKAKYCRDSAAFAYCSSLVAYCWS